MRVFARMRVSPIGVGNERRADVEPVGNRDFRFVLDDPLKIPEEADRRDGHGDQTIGDQIDGVNCPG